jgi:hypothetical protein
MGREVTGNSEDKKQEMTIGHFEQQAAAQNGLLCFELPHPRVSKDIQLPVAQVDCGVNVIETHDED